PGNITGSTATATISGLTAGTYTYTVTNSVGCISTASANVVINAQPATPVAPTVGTITQPTCAVATGSVVLTGLPSGNWTINPGNITGSTATTTISGLTAGTYTYTVTNSVGCTSTASANVVINAQPATPVAPTVGTITQPTCAVATGSVVLTGLPSGNWTINPGNITGSTATAIISGLAAGTYTYTVTNSVGCISTASANVVINNLICANDDTISSTGGSVLTNDTLNGNPVTTTNTDVTPVTNGPLTIDADGNLTVTPNTPSGTYTITYTICEVGANPANCDTATATVVVLNSIDAVNDTPAVVTVGDSTPSVVLNDTLDGSGPVVIGTNPGEVTLTGVTVPTGLTLNADGTITVNPLTPSGTYTVVYEICEVGATPTPPGNCDTATATVVVLNPIDAVNDTPAVVTVGDSTPSVVLNDTLDGSGPVVIGTNPGEVTLTGVTVPTGLTLNADGTITVNPLTPSGTYTVVYEICEVGATPTPPGNCDTATATVVVLNP
ncbi:beta strand repeat-containing protein, partial [Flavobacterium psychraquaticum]|uniref:beta strand repeat-containing protein n=1 Tax=Flavobacterium psychraquaticum TaxID=3103958 RepID=UPI003BEEE851